LSQSAIKDLFRHPLNSARMRFLKKAHPSILFQFNPPEQMLSNPAAGRVPAKQQQLLSAESNPISSGMPARWTAWPRFSMHGDGVVSGQVSQTL
jgi:hypothetical protein